jgi:hypothetical protein
MDGETARKSQQQCAMPRHRALAEVLRASIDPP